MKNLSFLSLLLLCTAFFACGNATPESTTNAVAVAEVKKVEPVKEVIPVAVGELSKDEIIPTASTEDEVKVEKEASKVAAASKNAPEKPKKEPAKISPKEKTKTPEKPTEVIKVVEEKTTTETPAGTAETKTTRRTTATIKDGIKKPAPKVKETPATKDVIVDKKVEKPAFSHKAWDQLLRKNVSSTGKVNYKGFKSQKAALELYLKSLADNPLQSSWSRNKKMAYWINAYNAFTVKLIVDNYPLSSITDLHGGKPWDQKWIKLGGKTYSLNNIENDILRPQYKDARIHFAVNCAAKSCPPLLNRAWTASNLEANFEKQAKAFINNTNHNSISADKIEISKIFEWYAVDFDNIINYLNKYSTSKINAGAAVSYKAYNWKLNE